jgi:hypothetical protein
MTVCCLTGAAAPTLEPPLTVSVPSCLSGPPCCLLYSLLLSLAAAVALLQVSTVTWQQATASPHVLCRCRGPPSCLLYSLLLSLAAAVALLQVSTVTWQPPTACHMPLSKPTLLQLTPTATSTWCRPVPGLRLTLQVSRPGPPTFQLELRSSLPS